jgi:protein subunit release factor A
MAVMKNSKGEIVAEQKVIVTAEGSLITSNTLYHYGQPVTQQLSVTDTQGRVRTSDITW